MYRRVSVSTLCFAGWPLADALSELERIGVGQVGVPFGQLVETGLGETTRLVRASGIRVANLVVPAVFTLDDQTRWADQQDTLRGAVDVAAELGAPLCFVTTGPAGRHDWQGAAAAFADALSPVRTHAERAGVALAVENTLSLRADLGFVHTLRDAVDVAQAAGCGVCAELYACWGERDVDETLARGVDALRLVQVSDFVLGTVSTPDRAVPGDGDAPLDRLVDLLLSSGYRGLFEVELMGPRIDREGPGAAVERAVRWLADRLPTT